MTKTTLLSREDAAKDLPQLRWWSNQLMSTIAEPIFKREDLLLNNNPFRLMCLSFLSRQFNHAQSLVALQNNRDMTLIARTMLEGMVLLMWVKQESSIRARLWRDFAFIHDWRLIKKHRESDIIVSDEVWERAEKMSRETGELFYTRQAREAIANSRPLPDDPYWKYWHSQERLNWFTIFKDVGHEDWYSNLYVGLCRWFHWESASIALSIKKEGKNFTFSLVREDDIYFAIMIEIICIHVTIQLTNIELSLGLSEELGRFRNDIHKWLQSRHSEIRIPQIST